MKCQYLFSGKVKKNILKCCLLKILPECLHYMTLFSVFQAPYNTVTYSIIGDDAAPSQFTISPSSGMISYRTDGSVNTDNTANYRVCHCHALYSFSLTQPALQIVVDLMADSDQPQDWHCLI